MQTDELIAFLSESVAPVKRGALARLVLGGVAAGVALSVVVMLAWLGMRPDFAGAMASFGMWTKLAYTFAIAAFALWLVERAGRPGAATGQPAALLVLPVLAILVISALQMMQPGADRHLLMMGHSARVCAFNILMVSLPTLAATLCVLRRMAPTRLVLAGAGAGLFAGAAGAFVYAFHCTESAAPFVAIWYSLGIAAVTGLGALVGRWALRWQV